MAHRLENRVIALEKHVRDLERYNAALASTMAKNNLVARVTALEGKTSRRVK